MEKHINYYFIRSKILLLNIIDIDINKKISS